MVTAQEVHNVTFDKSLRGYNLDQVDDFLDRVAEQLAANEKKFAELEQSNEELRAKLLEFARKLESYRNDEDALKSALLNAQRMGENVIREARQKADAIEREARIRSEDIVRVGAEKIKEQEIELARIKGEVAQFKANVLGLYKNHIESLSTLPDAELMLEEPEVEEPAAALPAAEPVLAAEPEVQPAPEETSSFWQRDEEEITAEIVVPMSGKNDTFRGITFSD